MIVLIDWRKGVKLNKTLLKQALLFQKEDPQHSKIKKLYELALDFQSRNKCFFLESKRGQRATIHDIDKFFEFVSESLLNNIGVSSFGEIKTIFEATSSREEAAKVTGDSKNSITKVFGGVVIYQKENENPVLYKNYLDINTKGRILAVENGETFLNIYPIMSKFGFNEFVYLGGFSNTATKEFLKDKDVVFFLDYDIEAIRIYDSFTCKKKEFFKHPNIEKEFQKEQKEARNEELYRKQLKNIPNEHNELNWLLELIKNNSLVVEQEVFNDTY